VDPDIHNGGSSVVQPSWTNISSYSATQWTALVVAFAIGFALASVIFRRRAR
jgi:hypothetical protein